MPRIVQAVGGWSGLMERDEHEACRDDDRHPGRPAKQDLDKPGRDRDSGRLLASADQRALPGLSACWLDNHKTVAQQQTFLSRVTARGDARWKMQIRPPRQ